MESRKHWTEEEQREMERKRAWKFHTSIRDDVTDEEYGEACRKGLEENGYRQRSRSSVGKPRELTEEERRKISARKYYTGKYVEPEEKYGSGPPVVESVDTTESAVPRNPDE